jgi:hypothetical protein
LEGAVDVQQDRLQCDERISETREQIVFQVASSLLDLQLNFCLQLQLPALMVFGVEYEL